MNKQSKTTVILSRIKPKYEGSAYGVYIIHDGILYFSSGKDLVRIKEHFPTTGATPERMIENIVRYDSEYLPKTMENGGEPCYTGNVNDVL
jgi:hypothetical protein